MKLEPDLYDRFHRKPRKPLRTATEVAADIGLSLAQFRGRIGSSKCDPPKPELKLKGGVRNTWYDPQLVREWWDREKTK